MLERTEEQMLALVTIIQMRILNAENLRFPRALFVISGLVGH